jgi:hypothetical protein
MAIAFVVWRHDESRTMKLRVGDIEMDSSTGIAFASTPGSIHAGLHHPASGHEQPPDLLREIRLPALSAPIWWGLAAVGALASASVIAVLVTGLVQNLFLASVLPPLLSVAVGGAVMARRAGVSGQPALASAELGALRATRITALLASATEPLTVERIATLLGWTEPAVVVGLGHLVREGRVQEDLDLASGHWVYALLPQADPHARAALPIAERERALVE